MEAGTRTEVLSETMLARFDAELQAALRRRTGSEGRLAGALRAVAPISPTVRRRQSEIAAVLSRKGGYERQLYAGAIRSLAECENRKTGRLLRTALASESAGGLATISAACFCRDPEISTMLSQLASGRNTHLAFAAELARSARGESNGALLVALAPKIKESHRIALCNEVFVPLARSAPLPPQVGPALQVLRDTERHLGRWLLLAQVATRAGDGSALEEARRRATVGPESSRSAWTLVEWALATEPGPPSSRPTLEMIARLSDRPSADRDLGFLFRMALARVPCVKPMLEGLVKSIPFSDEVAVRAAMHLIRDYGRDDLLPRVVDAATSSKTSEVRGAAAVALWDLGERSCLDALADELGSGSNGVAAVAWAALLMAAQRGRPLGRPLFSELTFRRVRFGWVE